MFTTGWAAREGGQLLQKISAKIRKYIVLRPEASIATALWTMTAGAHEGATHSPILAAISVEPDSKLDGALREVEEPTRLASTPGYLAFLLFSPRSGPSSSISDIEHASQTFAAELKRMRKVCALAVDPDLGFHANYDHAKHLSSQSAHVLMKGMSEKKITGTEGGGFRTIASLLYEAISGLPDTDVKRSCDSVLRNIRGPQTGTHGSQ
jgi:hypothetical protein